MKTTKAITLILVAFVIANLLSCTLSITPEGRPIASVDVVEAYARATQIIAEK